MWYEPNIKQSRELASQVDLCIFYLLYSFLQGYIILHLRTFMQPPKCYLVKSIYLVLLDIFYRKNFISYKENKTSSSILFLWPQKLWRTENRVKKKRLVTEWICIISEIKYRSSLITEKFELKPRDVVLLQLYNYSVHIKELAKRN